MNGALHQRKSSTGSEVSGVIRTCVRKKAAHAAGYIIFSVKLLDRLMFMGMTPVLHVPPSTQVHSAWQSVRARA